MKVYMIFFMFLVWSVFSFGFSLSQQELKNKGLRIIFSKGKLTVKSNPSSLRSSHLLNINIIKGDDRGAIGKEVVQVKEEWLEIDLLNSNLGRRHSHFEIEVTGESVPLEVYSLDSNVQILGWNDKIAMTLQKSLLNIQNLEGSLNAYISEGKTNIIGVKGDVFLDSFRSTIVARQIDGNLKIENYWGDNDVEEIVGNVDISSFNGQNLVSNGKGTLDFVNGRGLLSVKGIIGRISGKNNEGSVQLALSSEPQVRLESDAGRVQLNVPNSSGAWINIGSEDGPIYYPKFLKLTRGSNLKVVTGRLKGTNRGSIFVRTKEAPIFLQ